MQHFNIKVTIPVILIVMCYVQNFDDWWLDQIKVQFNLQKSLDFVCFNTLC